MKFECQINMTLLLNADDITTQQEVRLCVSEFMTHLTQEQKNDNPSVKNWTLRRLKENK